MCESRSRTTSWPGCVCASTETRLPWVPDVTNSPAALPRRSAAIASRRLMVGSSSQTSSPTSARAMASRISGVGNVSVSERRSTVSCTASPHGQAAEKAAPPRSWALLSSLQNVAHVLALGREPGRRPPTELGDRVIRLESLKQIAGRLRFALPEVHLGEQPERLRDDQRSRVLFEHQLETLPRGAGVPLVEVVVRHPDFFLCEPAAADVDLGQPIGRIPALRIVLDQLLELVERLPRQRLVLLDRLDLIVEGHRQPILHEVGDLMLRVERHERFELFDGLVELALAILGLADQEARAWRVRRVRMALHDPRVVVACLGVLPLLERLVAEAGELVGRQDRRWRRTQPGAAASGHEQAREDEVSDRWWEAEH